MKNRIGFYICHCGANIAGVVRVEEVRAYMAAQPEVIVSRDHLFMCSDPGQELIENDIREYELNSVVVASCSPRMHERTFRRVCQGAGLNPYGGFHMVCLREHCSWITDDPDRATVLAKGICLAGVKRILFHQDLETRLVPVNSAVLVVGGGIAGMQAALDTARAGYKTYLVEKQPTIGGHMLRYDKTFPTLDCAACIGTPKMVAVGQHRNIELLTYSQVIEVTGYIGNFKVRVHKKPRYVQDNCTGCGECSRVCPVERPSEWDEGLKTRKAIYRSFPQAVPLTFVLEKKDRPPCRIACPAGVNVQGYIQLIGQGKYREAVGLILERLPLPGVLGRLCPGRCEAQCRRSEVDEPVAIRELKRFAADRVDWEELPLPEIKERPERVAVIGSGPAGLTAAHYLRLKGYQVTIFEALEELGGMLRVGLPEYKIPRRVLDQEIRYTLRLGVETRKGQRLGIDFTLADLEQEGFQAIFMGIGAHCSPKLNLPGEEYLRGVVSAIDFLAGVNQGRQETLGRRVVIIGGNNIAVSAARTAARLGCEKVHLVYSRSREEMPAFQEEIEGALAEGVEIHYRTTPVCILGAEKKVAHLECLRTELGPPDSSGRRRPIPFEGSEFAIECDLIISALSQFPDLGWVKDIKGLEVSRQGTLSVNPDTMGTSRPNVFAAGDMVSGPATVIEAVASAHKAVAAMDRYLQGEDLSALVEESATREAPGRDWLEIPKDMAHEPRARVGFRPLREGKTPFDEVNLGFQEDEARREAHRCLNCGICSECMECVRICQAGAIDHEMKEEEVEFEVGGIILATGFNLMNPGSLKQYGYGRYPNVFTSLEFERLTNPTGPTGGAVLTRNEKGLFDKPPASTAIIHCVGSRDLNHHEYCSRVCCMYALKYGHLIRERVGPQARVWDFYIDQRCFGKGYEEFYHRCQKEGIDFIRGRPAEITAKAVTPEEEGRLVVIGEDTLLGRRYRIPVDMVILCPAIEPGEDSAELSRLFGVTRGPDGFFLEEHPKLEPVSTSISGIFIAGACQGPKDIPDTVAQAKGAAGEAQVLLGSGQVEVSPMISWIDPELCIGCRVCRELCVYSAIEFDRLRGVSVVNQAVCKGCGNCAVCCPNGAARVLGFTDKQIFAEIGGLLA